MDTLQWDDVRYFLALSREGTLSATARALNVEHSTVARRVSNLESTLKVKLFDRLSRGWVLTAEGESLARQAALLEEDMLCLWRAALGNSTLSGTVRLSAPPILMQELLVPRIKGFHEKYPDINLELIGETRGADLMRGEAEIAVRMVEPTNPQLVARLLCDVTYNLYATSAWALQPRDEWVFIGFDDSCRHWQKTWLEQQVGRQRYALRTNDLRAMYQAARAGLGVALLPRFLAGCDSQLVVMPMLEEPLRCPLYLAMHADVWRAPRVRATAEFLIELFQAEAQAL